MHTTVNTKSWRQRALATMPVGSSTNSKAPTLLPEEPEVIVRGAGCRVWDDRGREFIDYRNALGPIVLGYAHPAVNDAITAQLRDGIIFGHPHPLETTTAELFCSLVPGAEAARFLKTGGEAMAAVIRIARAHTGRNHVIQIGYNGWLNSLAPGARVLPGQSMQAGIPGVPEALSLLHHDVAWEDRDHLQQLFTDHGDDVALVLVAADYPPLEHSREFYEFLRNITTQHGALLAYDEIVTGFRVAFGGMAEFTGVIPDLSVYGKGIANGMPLSVYCGRRDILSILDRREVVVSSTHGGETLSLAAATATMKTMMSEGVIERLREAGDRFRDGVSEVLRRHGLPMTFEGHGACPQFLAEDSATVDNFFRAAYRNGVSLYRVSYVNASHSDADIDETIERLNVAAKELSGH